VRSGRALYAGISSYNPEQTRRAAAILAELGTPCVIHQPSYSMINRWVEDGLLATLDEEGIGCIAFSPLAQGVLTNKYLEGIPEGSRASKAQGQGRTGWENRLKENVDKVSRLNEIARARGQNMAQMALAWVLRHPGMTSALIGASRVAQIEEAVAALSNLEFSSEELAQIESILRA
jgi:L-glyceraldehyde 3-phosphate reductase